MISDQERMDGASLLFAVRIRRPGARGLRDMKVFFAACLILLLCSPAVPSFSQESGPGGFVYMTEQYPPYNYEENGEQKGISVDVLRAVWERMGEKAAPVRFMPWARAYRDVQEKPGMVLFSMARTPAREDLFQWACPIVTARFMLYALAKNTAKMEKLDDVERYSVGVIRDDITDILLKPYAGRTRIEAVGDMTLNMKKLDAGRIDLVAYSEEGFPEFLRRNGRSESDYRAVFPLADIQVCYAFSRDADAAFVARFQDALAALNAEGRVEKIDRSYRKK